MRWFNESAGDSNDDEWDRRVAAYSAHLAEIAPRLPTVLKALSSDPRLDLHDGRFRRVTLDRRRREITMVIDCGSLDLGYRQLTLRFVGATMTPDNLQLLAEAIGAEYRANHWHERRTVTEIRYVEVDVTPDGRFVLRLRLWPFHEFALEFAELSIAEAALASRGPGRAGRFEITPEA